MNNKLLNKFGLSLFYIIMAVFIEIVTFVSLDIGVFPHFYMYNLSIMLMIMGLIFIIPNYLAQYIVSMIFIAVQIVLLYVNYTLNQLYGDVFSFDMLNLFKEAGKAMTRDFTYLWITVVLSIMLITIGILGFILYYNLKKHKIPFKKNFSVLMVMILLIVQGLGGSIYLYRRNEINSSADVLDENYVLSDEFLMNTTILKLSSLKRFGSFGYYVNNILSVLSKKDADSRIANISVDYFNNSDLYGSEDSQVFGVDKGNNVLVVMMESLEWFGFSNGEFNSHICSPELTPNIYNLMQESFIATDFFAKSKTNISEGIGILGSYPIGKNMIQIAGNSYKKSNNTFGFSMPSVLSNKNYITSYFHSNESGFYDRKKTHTNIGFQNTYFLDSEELGFDGPYKWGYWVKEEDFVYSALDYMIPKESSKTDYGENRKNFYTFYTTVSTHGPYTYNQHNADQMAYADYVKYLDTANTTKTPSSWYTNVLKAYGNNEDLVKYLVNYEAGVIGLDRAIGVLIQQLKDYDIYDDTTIVLYADHNAYYHSMSNLIKGINESDYSNIELNTIPLIIKSKGLRDYKDGEHTGITSTNRFCSAYDLVPTLFDLLGINYNPKFYPGNSLFTATDYVASNKDGNQEDVVVYYSHTGGLYSKEVYTQDMKSLYYDESTIHMSYINTFKSSAKSILTKLNYVSMLYNYNIYNKITTK